MPDQAHCGFPLAGTSCQSEASEQLQLWALNGEPLPAAESFFSCRGLAGEHYLDAQEHADHLM